jgi:transposase
LKSADTCRGRNFFDSLTGKRKGPKIEPPQFRSRKDRRHAIRFTANAKFKVLGNGRLRLPKIGDVPVRWSRPLPSVPSSVTVIRDSAGRFFASFVVLDDGTKVGAPRFLRRAEKKLKRAQRALSRKQKGSKNRNKARVKVARAHARIADARRDFHHKLSTKVIRENQAVTVEDLAVNGLARTRLAKWTCQVCGTTHDRDVNAAKNIAALGRREALNARGGQVRPAETLAPAVETGSLRGAA